MTIKTSTFGGTILTGKAVQAFQEQFLQQNQKPNIAAQNSLKNGREILKELKRKNYAVIKSKA